jgi:predicted metalloprotease with PDZ domain
VPFGRVIRDGGETIELFVNENRPIRDFYDDWTATHEFSHLMLPYVRSRHRWVSEGFASYYQNVLLARAGQYTEERAWQRLYEGFERGRGSMPSQSPNATAADRSRGGTMKIYWSGAAIALMADVELRARSGGRESLDTALEQLAACCLPSERRWSGPELFEKLDEFVAEPVFMPLYERYADERGFPDYRATFAELGVDIVRGRVRFDNDADQAALRRAIMDGSEGR